MIYLSIDRTVGKIYDRISRRSSQTTVECYAFIDGDETMPYVRKTMPSPVGTLTLVASDQGVAAILWENDKPMRVPLGPLLDDDGHPILLAVEGQLREYFAGSRTAFDVPLDFRGTDFQKLVWAELLNIPFGETRSYAEIARMIGRPTACRAVGAANGRNPISIIAPCHRVVGHDGSLTGFAGGLEAKLHLLDLERAAQPPPTDRSIAAEQPDIPGLD
jgi:methylated-DNA-[protein]-cysteine S-methyltransferase